MFVDRGLDEFFADTCCSAAGADSCECKGGAVSNLDMHTSHLLAYCADHPVDSDGINPAYSHLPKRVGCSSYLGS